MSQESDVSVSMAEQAVERLEGCKEAVRRLLLNLPACGYGGGGEGGRGLWIGRPLLIAEGDNGGGGGEFNKLKAPIIYYAVVGSGWGGLMCALTDR